LRGGLPRPLPRFYRAPKQPRRYDREQIKYQGCESYHDHRHQSDHRKETRPPKVSETTSSPPPAPVLKVKPDLKYEGARAAWYGALLKHNGKSENDFIDACTKSPPALPKSGKSEKPSGWLRYFVREGVASLG
jgi:hypothetical protein